MPTGNLNEVESSDDHQEFFGVAEGEEAPGDEESSSTSNRTEMGEEEMSSNEEDTGAEDIDYDAPEDDETDADAEEPLPNGYDADRRHYTQGSVPFSSTTGTSTPIADSKHLPYRGSSSAAADRSNVVPDPEKDIFSNNSAGEEDADMDDLVHAMSAMAPTFSDDDGTMNPDIVPNAQIVQDSPNTSTESATLLGTIREGFSATLLVNPSTILGPDVPASVNDNED
ncbi:hypothetical protein FRC01_007761 [Tulasnella sp. 417]|nr:hypothetical protein FRC01_007761 [Tulasnella sp. 417]